METGSITQWFDSLTIKVQAAAAAAAQDAVFAATNETLAAIKARIFDGGTTTEGGSIGTYSTDRIYVAREVFFFKKPSGGTLTKGGNYRFDGGWSEARNSVGRQSNNVDLTFSGDLSLSVQTVKESDNRLKIGITDKENAAKAKGNEAHFGKVIFDASEKEKQAHKEAIKDYFARSINSKIQ